MIIVLTIAYNAENTLARTIESILSQTYGDFRYYALDNASTDSTYDIISEYADKDERITALKNEINIFRAAEAGLTAKWNILTVLELASSEYPDGCYF